MRKKSKKKKKYNNKMDVSASMTSLRLCFHISLCARIRSYFLKLLLYICASPFLFCYYALHIFYCRAQGNRPLRSTLLPSLFSCSLSICAQSCCYSRWLVTGISLRNESERASERARLRERAIAS
jgi:hypothetical protein